LGRAAAAEGQVVVNALDMDGNNFDRACSRPAMIIKVAKKAAYYSKIRHSPQSLARRPLSLLFLPYPAGRFVVP
jgi:hypothetical protein